MRLDRPPPANVKARSTEEEHEDDERLMYVALTRAMGRVYLPAVVRGGEAGKVRGPYDSLHRRVNALVRARHPLVSVETMEDTRSLPNAPRPANDTYAESPSPPVHLLGSRETRDYALLRSSHAGTQVTSYTRIRAGRGRGRPTSSVPEMMREPSARRDEKALAEDPGPSATLLRSARASGIFVHELLERIPLQSFAGATFDAWRARTDVSALFAEALTIHRVDPAQRAHAEQLVWRAYSTAMRLPGGSRIDGIARAKRVVREMDFVFSVPGSRVIVRGSLDIAFEHEGLTYFADWKTDSRGDYSQGALERHVEEHYGEQVRLYALAVTKLLQLEDRAPFEDRFGGILYCFLRGMDGTDAGVWCTRPSWEEVGAWGERLREEGSTLEGARA